MNLYKEAVRNKLRWSTAKGRLSVEDLFDLSLSELDALAVALYKKAQDTSTQSFITQNKDDAKAQLSFSVVKDVLDERLKEKEQREQKQRTEEEKQKLLDLLQKKEEEELLKLSKEELEKKLSSLG